jgi:hypothetical protein
VTSARPSCGCCDGDVALTSESEPVQVEPDDDVEGFDNWSIFDTPEGQAA